MRKNIIPKKILSLLMAIAMLVSVFAVGLSGMIAEARSVGIGSGAESFDYVDVYQTTEACGSTTVNTSVTVKVTDLDHQIRVNSISESLPFYASGVTDGNLSVSYTAGTIVKQGSSATFTVSGTIAATTNSIVRYVVNFDVLDVNGNTIWKNLTTYGYGSVSGTAKQSGAVGTQSGTPGILHQEKGSITNSDVCNWRWKPGLNPHMAPNYVQPTTGSLTASTQNYSERSAWRNDTKFTIYPKVTSGTLPNFFTFNSKGIFFTDSDYRLWGSGPSNAVVKEADEDFGSTLDQTWVSWTTPTVSGYWSFTYDLAGDHTPSADTNYTGSVNIYNIYGQDKADAKNLLEQVTGLNGNHEDGYYVQKDLYTEESWDAFVSAMDVAALVAYATPNATWGYRQACEKAASADDNLLKAFNALTLNTDSTGEHSHNWTAYHVETTTVQPACGTTGTKVQTCLCGATNYITLDALEHEMTPWTVYQQATCKEIGVETRNCSRCHNAIESKEIPKLDHTEEILAAKDPTCATPGKTEGKKCSVCGEVLVRQQNIPALPHTYGDEWIVLISPTCSTTGTKVRACTVCGASDPNDGGAETIPTLPHEYESVVKAPTCTEEGYTTYTCKACGHSYKTDEVAALGHSGEFEIRIPATCTTEGTKYRKCTVCGEEETVYEEPLGHNMVTDEAVAPDCENTGFTEGSHCTRCNEATTPQEEVPALGHKYEGAVTVPTCTDKGFTTFTCSVCGDTYVGDYVDALGHTEAEAVIENNVDPDCVNDGSYDSVVYCTVCDEELSRNTITVDALGHTEVIDEGKDATCKDTGLTEGKHCEACGEILVAQKEIPANGHSFGDWEVTTYPTFEKDGIKTKSCANCDAEETEAIRPVKLKLTRIISAEIDGNNITLVSYTNADTIAFNRSTVAGDAIEFDNWYDEEDKADEPTPIKKGDESERWIIYHARWEQYAENGEYVTTMTIGGIEYNLTVVFNDRELEANDVVLVEKFTNITVDNENKVITLVPPKGTDSITLKETSREYDEFTYTIAADNYDNVTHNAVSGSYRGSYTISSNGEFETEITVTVNKGKYCQTDYTLKVIFIDFDLVEALKPLRGTVSLETYEDGREYLEVTMLDGQTSTGLYKTGVGQAITDVSIEFAEGNVTEKDNLYVAYTKSNTSNPKGVATIELSNGSVLTYDIEFDMGLVESDVDPLAELKLIRSTASFDADGTLRITRNAGLAASAGAGFYAVTTAGEAVTFTASQGTIYAGRTDAYVAYLTQNTSNVVGTISYTLSDGTKVECNAVIDLGLGDEYVEPEESAFDIAAELKAIRGTVSATDDTVTITVASGMTMTGIYNTTKSGYTVEIKDANGTFAARTDAYVAYKTNNSANVEGTMVVTLADGTVYEYAVIFDLGL